ncbi:hypothetical protein DWG14_08436 [Streptomyces griseorubiginosus]|uniref:Uncharacterized protein n=1 Tax=Streptomyces griseorubiginosus TaxID=67304 RepID=A0AAI8LA48_9ACTN|nr:hypothetical protein DWG14_08436 [Streptomyces griseorubiginosus]
MPPRMRPCRTFGTGRPGVFGEFPYPTPPLHVPAERIERSWQQANDRLTGRLLGPAPWTARSGTRQAAATDTAEGEGGGRMRWELRLRAAERGVFTAVEKRRLLTQAGLLISAGKMSALCPAAVAPVSVRLVDDLEVLCRVLRAARAPLLVPERPPDPLVGGWSTAADPPGTGSGEHPGWAGPQGEAWSGPRPVQPKLPPLWRPEIPLLSLPAHPPSLQADPWPRLLQTHPSSGPRCPVDRCLPGRDRAGYPARQDAKDVSWWGS